jgi:Fe2+ transport system protein FeoA
MRCPLCNYEFDESQMTCHTSCAFNKGCAVICCPNCGYQMVDESKTRFAGWLRRRFERKSPEQPALCRLSELRPGQSCTVVSVETDNATRQERLSTFGILPGAEITLRQHHPAYVLRVGFTELSIERDIADAIVVSRKRESLFGI